MSIALIRLFFNKRIIGEKKMVLTKSDILQGIKTPKKIMIENLNGEIWLRPLSSAEIDEIMNIEAQGYGTFNAKAIQGKTNADAKMNLAKMQEKQAEAKYIAIHKSINNNSNSDGWELNEIKELPADAINEMYDKIMDLSGASVTTKDVESFPED